MEKTLMQAFTFAGIGKRQRKGDPDMRLNYGWRVSEFSVSRDGFYACVERFWCTSGDQGWRWSGFRINSAGSPAEPRQMVSDPVPLMEAMAAAEKWITEQAAAPVDSNFYAEAL